MGARITKLAVIAVLPLLVALFVPSATALTSGQSGGENTLHKSESGYFIDSSTGFTIQWKSVPRSEDVWTTHSFPRPFDSEAVSITATGSSGLFATDTEIQARIVSRSQFAVKNNAYYSGSIYIQAFGY